jgi:hypothetical protein
LEGISRNKKVNHWLSLQTQAEHHSPRVNIYLHSRAGPRKRTYCRSGEGSAQCTVQDVRIQVIVDTLLCSILTEASGLEQASYADIFSPTLERDEVRYAVGKEVVWWWKGKEASRQKRVKRQAVFS